MTVFILTAFLAYLAATAYGAMRARHAETQPGGLPQWPMTLLGAAALVLHAVAIHREVNLPVGLNLGWVTVFSVTAWLIGLLSFLSSLRAATANLAVGIFPLVGMAVLLLPFARRTSTVLRDLSWQLEMHILLSVLAYGLLALAAFQAIVLAVQHRRLRRHRPGGLLRALPPLAELENLLFHTVTLGFALLSLALLSGLVFLEDMFAQHLAHKTILSICAWVVFGVLLWGRWRFGWRGRTAARVTLAGFGLLALAYFGSKFVLELIKGVHWG